jgi:hypothetical protein
VAQLGTRKLARVNELVDHPTSGRDLLAERRPARVRVNVDRWMLLIVVAFALRVALALALALSQLRPHNGWYWANDDQVEYYGTAHGLIHGGLASVYTFIGYGVLLAPFTVGTEFVLQALPIVGLIQFLLAVPAAVLLYRATVRLADRRAAAVATAAWLTTPIWLTAIWLPSYSKPFSLAPAWLGILINVDYVSALLAICVLYVAAGAISDASARRGMIIGLFAGTAFLAKPSNIVIVASALTALAVWRRWRAAAAAAVVTSVVFSAQLVVNWRLKGNPTTFAYADAWPFGDTKAIASIAYIPRSLGKLFLFNYTGPLLVVAAATALIIAWRRFPATRWLVVAQVVGFVLFFSPLYYSISEFMIRFLTPALPGLCIAIGCAVVGRRRSEDVSAIVAPPGRAATAVSTAAVLGAVALTVFVAVAPVVSDLPTVSSMSPRGTVTEARRVDVSWDAPESPARLSYQVTRSRGPSGKERSLGITDSTTMTDRPTQGTWWYRVYLVPSYRPHGWSTSRTLGISEPVRIVVPR